MAGSTPCPLAKTLYSPPVTLQSLTVARRLPDYRAPLHRLGSHWTGPQSRRRIRHGAHLINNRSAGLPFGVQAARLGGATATAGHGGWKNRSGIVLVPRLVRHQQAGPGGVNGCGRCVGCPRRAKLQPHQARLKAKVKRQSRVEVREGHADAEQGDGTRQRGAGQAAVRPRAGLLYAGRRAGGQIGSCRQAPICRLGEVLVGCGELGDDEAGLER
eukprot:scaffold12475_cov63-Isochrysis_galbana.AAC.2